MRKIKKISLALVIIPLLQTGCTQDNVSKIAPSKSADRNITLKPNENPEEILLTEIIEENSSLLPDTNNSNYILLSENEPLRPSHELTEIIEYQEENSTKDITPTTITEVEEDITDIENSWTTLN